MAYCELCGIETQILNDSIVAGSNMRVCKKCSNHGKVIESQPAKHNFYRGKKVDSNIEELVSNYNQIIQKELQKKNLNSHHLARGANIKESELNQYLSKKIKPDINTAKKIEKYLGVKIVQSGSSNDTLINYDEGNDTSLTLGDLIKKQMNK